MTLHIMYKPDHASSIFKSIFFAFYIKAKTWVQIYYVFAVLCFWHKHGIDMLHFECIQQWWWNHYSRCQHQHGSPFLQLVLLHSQIQWQQWAIVLQYTTFRGTSWAFAIMKDVWTWPCTCIVLLWRTLQLIISITSVIVLTPLNPSLTWKLSCRKLAVSPNLFLPSCGVSQAGYCTKKLHIHPIGDYGLW